MRSEQPPILEMSALGSIVSARRRIADVERAVVPHGMHDHRQLARHGDTGLAVAGAFGDRLAPALDLVPALEARHQPRRRLVERPAYVRVAGLRDAALNVDRGARLPASRRQPEVGRGRVSGESATGHLSPS